MKTFRILLCLAALLLALAPPASAEEAIDNYISTVTVHPDGSMRVREEITVTAEGGRIKRGLYRDFPLNYSGPEEYHGEVPFKVVSATLDGWELPTDDVERHGEIIRVLMRRDNLLSRGRHRFVLEYDTSMHLRFYAAGGELNWNVTGNWAFPIKQYSCRIILPEGVPVEKTTAWAGAAGSKNTEGVEVSLPAPNEALFTRKAGAGAVLAPGEQFTVAVAFPKDAVADPVAPFAEEQRQRNEEANARMAEQLAASEAEKQTAYEEGFFSRLRYDLEDFFSDAFVSHVTLIRQFALFCALFAYFFLCWRKLGKDPDKGTIIPRFQPPMAVYMGKGEPPADFTPAPMSPLAVEYLRKETRTTPVGLAALFLSLAGKKLCRISRTEEGVYVLRPAPIEKTAEPAPTLSPPLSPPLSPALSPALSPEARDAHSLLLKAAGETGELPITPRQDAMRRIESKADARVAANYGKAWSLNSWVSVLGWALLLPLALTLSFWEADLSPYVTSTGSIELTGPALTFFVCVAFCFAIAASAVFIRAEARVSAVTLGVSIFPLAALYILFSEGFFQGVGWILPTGMVIVGVVFPLLMQAPSKAARAVLDEIEGLIMYMDAAEKDRLEMLHRPEDSPEVFQNLLPYALVLGLEKTWCNRFADQIAAGAFVDTGVDDSLFRDRNAWAGFTTGFAGAITASAAAPVSSSSGSAFSGGGGGAGSGSGGGGGGGI